MTEQQQQQALQEFQRLQKQLGGTFKKVSLNPRIYHSVIYAVDRENTKTHLTRLALVGPHGFVLKHFHKSVEEKLTLMYLHPDAYGHLIFPEQHKRLRLEEHVGIEFTFEPGMVHGIAVLRGFAIFKTEVYGEFSIDDVFVPHHH
ncbi:MAG: hypothetical protein RLZZ517_386 [Candidatus Parcubacteria bacterium]|jgi:hypothetical protein